MKRKGFTLIELLAVIVILAILALIVSPIISGVITNAKMSAAERSLEGYVSAIELAEIKYQTEHAGSVTRVLGNLSIEAKSKDKVNISGYDILDSGLVSSVDAIVDGYYCMYTMENGARCAIDEDSLVPNHLLSPIANYQIQRREILDQYNFSDECYYDESRCNSEEQTKVDQVTFELDLLNRNYYEIIDVEMIRSIIFYSDGTVLSGAEVLDVSSNHDNSIKLYYKETGGMYDIAISSNSKILFPPNSNELFAFMNNIEQINFNNSIDTKYVRDMSFMFYSTGYSSESFTLDVSSFKTSKVTNMRSMFDGTGYGSENISIDISGFDTTNVTNMNSMFNQFGVESDNVILDVSHFNTEKVTDMSHMFSYVTSPHFEINLSSFDTSNVTAMEEMFLCTGSSSDKFTLDISNFNTSKVTDMRDMFVLCGANSPLFSLTLGPNFITTNVENMSRMFSGMGYNVLVTSFNLGPGFTNIPIANDQMLETLYKSGDGIELTIFVPASIWIDATHLRINNGSSLVAPSNVIFQKIS